MTDLQNKANVLTYQIFHPWHWLTYGQNASGFAAVTAGIATIGAVVAGTYAVRAYRTTYEQLRIAKNQDERDLKRHLETLRPHLSTEVDENRLPRNGGIFVRVRNIGTGRATKIERLGIVLSNNMSQPGGSDYLAIIQMKENHPSGPGHHTAFLWYSSLDGRRFRTETLFLNAETIGNEMVVEIGLEDEPTLFHHLQVEVWKENGCFGSKPPSIRDPRKPDHPTLRR